MKYKGYEILVAPYDYNRPTDTNVWVTIIDSDFKVVAKEVANTKYVNPLDFGMKLVDTLKAK